MTPLLARLTVTLVAFGLLLTAALVLWILELRDPALVVSGMMAPIFVVLLDQLRGANDLRRSGYHAPISPPPPARSEDITVGGRRRREPSKRDRITPTGRMVDDMIAARRYVEARVIAVQTGDSDALERIRIAEDIERKAARRADDTRSRRERGE